MHKSDFLWLTFHQMHHSAERLDTYGTFNNPKTFEHETGFFRGASSKIFEMLTFKDVNKLKDQSEIKI